MSTDNSPADRLSARTAFRVDPPVSTETFLDRVQDLGPVEDIENCYDTALSGSMLAEAVGQEQVNDGLSTTVEKTAVASFSFKTDREVSYMTLSDSTVQERTETDERTVSVFYHEDGYAFVSGPGGRTATEGETVAKRLFDAENTAEVDVDEAFLRWLVLQAHSGESLGPKFDINRVTLAHVVGGGPPEEFQLTGDDPLGNQQPRRFLERMRDGHRIDKLSGDFTLWGFDLHGNITTYAGISAGLVDGDTAEAAATGLVGGLLFCLQTLELFEQRSEMAESEREPSQAFEDTVEKALASQGDT